MERNRGKRDPSSVGALKYVTDRRDLVAGTEFQTTVVRERRTCMRGNELTAFSLGRPLCPGNAGISPQFSINIE